MDADQIIEIIKDTPLSEKDSGRIMAALLRKTLGEALVGAGMDLMLSEDEQDERAKAKDA